MPTVEYFVWLDIITWPEKLLAFRKRQTFFHLRDPWLDVSEWIHRSPGQGMLGLAQEG